jgi:hypothetical protein
VSFALEGGREGPEENARENSFRWHSDALDNTFTRRPAALRIACRVDLEIQVPKPPSGKLPEQIQAELDSLADVFEGIPAFEDVGLPTREERIEARREREEIEERENAEESVAVIQAIVALEWTHTRNPPSVADTFEVTIPSRHLPVDLRVFDQMRIQAWTFVRNAADESFDDRLDRCQPGDPGHFAGIVDNLEVNRKAGTLTLTCRDLTAIPLSREITGATLKGLDLKDPVDKLVEEIMELSVPGGELWKVEPRGRLQAAARTPVRVLSDEKRKRVRRKRKVLTFDFDTSPTPEASSTEGKPYKAEMVVGKSGVKGFQSRHWRIGRLVGKLPASRVALIVGDLHLPKTPELAEPEFVDETYSKTVTVRVPPTTEGVFGSEKLSVWDAITKLCAKLSVIPEVTLAEDGSPLIVLVDAEDYLDARFFRAFERAGRKHRIITYGRDIADMAESRDLTAGDRIDWVECIAIDPDKGLTRRERFGKPGGREAGSGLQLPFHGTTKRSHLKRLARQAWLNANAGELEISVEIDVPWSTGGGVDDPDLLQAAAGTIVEVEFAVAKRFRGNALEDILMKAPIFMPAHAAKVLGRASERSSPSLVFQVAELVHSGSGEGDGSYSCQITLQTFLDDGLSPQELEAFDT